MIRDRIVELRRVKAADLLPNARNWRTHPKAQREALAGVLAEVGYADALVAYETPEGLRLIDGHLRAESTPDATVPVLVLDVTEAEAEKLLATMDPLAAMAGRDESALSALLADVSTSSDGLQALLTSLSSSPSTFSPVLTPETSTKAVTAEDVGKKRDELDAKFHPSESVNLVEVTCPHCAADFLLDPEKLR